MTSFKGVLAAAAALVLCPCHLPLLAGPVFGGLYSAQVSTTCGSGSLEGSN